MATEFCRMQSPSAMTHQFSHCPGSVPFFLAWVCFAMFLLFLQFIGVILLLFFLSSALRWFKGHTSFILRLAFLFWYQLSSCVLFGFWDELQFEGARSVYSRECATVNSQNSYLWSIELISVCKLFLVYCVIHNTVLCYIFSSLLNIHESYILFRGDLWNCSWVICQNLIYLGDLDRPPLSQILVCSLLIQGWTQQIIS